MTRRKALGVGGWTEHTDGVCKQKEALIYHLDKKKMHERVGNSKFLNKRMLN